MGRPRIPLLDRVVDKVKFGDGCWQWTGKVGNHGYGVVSKGAPEVGTLLVHRAVYELAVGPIPDGLTIDHLCCNKTCVNPDHMEPVTLAENWSRGARVARSHDVPKTHCKNGHPLFGENLYRWGTERRCRACGRAAQTRYVRNRRG